MNNLKLACQTFLTSFYEDEQFKIKGVQLTPFMQYELIKDLVDKSLFLHDFSDIVNPLFPSSEENPITIQELINEIHSLRDKFNAVKCSELNGRAFMQLHDHESEEILGTISYILHPKFNCHESWESFNKKFPTSNVEQFVNYINESPLPLCATEVFLDFSQPN